MKSRVGLYTLALFFAVIGASASSAPSVMADGIGGGGSGGGGGGGHQTSEGWGWRLYPLSGGGPSNGFRNGTSWNTVRNACRNSSSQAAVMVGDNSSNQQMGYDYQTRWYSPVVYSGYRGNSGAPYINMTQARNGFNAISPAVRAGYTFGVNVSWYCYGSLPAWTTSGTSSVNASIVSPGTQVTWTHRAINQGPANTNKAISATVTRTNFGPASSAATGRAAGVARNGTVASASRVYRTTIADGGKTICERLNWSPNAYNSAGNESSANACVQVRLGGGVSQQLLFDPADDVVDDSAEVDIKFDASNTTGVALNVNFDGYVWYDRNNNGVFDGATETKVFTRGGSGSLPGSPTTTTVTSHLETVDISKGGRICGFWNVTTTNPLATNLDGPDVECAYIGFTPKAQVWGNDLRVGSSNEDSLNQESTVQAVLSRQKDTATGITNYFGSWGEYGVLAPGDGIATSTVSGFGSGAMLGAPSGAASSDQSQWSKLTFANDGATGCVYGCFTTASGMGVIPDVEGYLEKNSLILGNVTRTTGTYTIGSNITADPSGVQKIIIADDIIISDSVDQIDAWLIARNTINTCVKGGSQDLIIGDCRRTLRINGPVMAKEVNLRRIGDAQVQKNQAVGEIINLRGDAYIWAYKTTHASSSYVTTSVRDLAPRY